MIELWLGLLLSYITNIPLSSLFPSLRQSERQSERHRERERREREERDRGERERVAWSESSNAVE